MSFVERIRDECVIKIPCIDPKSDVHLSTRSGKKKKGRRGRCGRRAPRTAPNAVSVSFAIEEGGQVVPPRSKKNCNESWTGLICVESGSKRGKREKKVGRTVDVNSTVRSVALSFREVLLRGSCAVPLPRSFFSMTPRSVTYRQIG